MRAARARASWTVLLGLGLARLAGAVDLPPGFASTVWARGIVRPTAMAFTPDGRLLVCEQTGALRVVANGTLRPQPFVSLTVHSHRERGLVGVTVDPDFAHNGYVYLYYTALKPRVHNRLSRFTAAGDRAVPGSEKVLLDLPDLRVDREVHNGGALHFGHDGKLYLSVGENHTAELAQSFASPLGKLLRIERDGTIPSDNPFYRRTTGMARAIWALGLRNPFTFAVSPATGRMLVDDVGDQTWEEIDDAVAGANFGWPLSEGPTTNPAFRSPLFAYRHGSGPTTGCAIAGGTFYEPAVRRFPAEFQGSYLFADFCGGWVRRLDLADASAHDFAAGLDGPVDLDVGPDGALYVLGYDTGTVVRIDHPADLGPQIGQQPADQLVSVGGTARFAVAASGAPPLAYQWRRDGVDLPGATTPAYERTGAAASDDGALFDVVVRNAYGQATSRRARLAVTSDRPPVASIAEPANGSLYAAGNVIHFAGAATDPESGALPATALTWWIDLHHESHFHPFLLETHGVAAGTFAAPTSGETSTHVWYRVHLRAVDPIGLTGETFVDVLPRVSTLALATDPPGLGVSLDGVPFATPHVEPSVVGMLRTLGAPSPQAGPGGLFELAAWSDGGAPIHDVATPATDTTYTARFRPHVGGLAATYFDEPDLAGAHASRIDSVVDFDFTGRAPIAGLSPDTWSARWTGSLQPTVTGATTLFVRSDDGARLWVNGTLVIDHWAAHASTVDRATVDLTAGQPVPIVLEYYQLQGAGGVRLLWSAPGLPRQVVPTSQLSP